MTTDPIATARAMIEPLTGYTPGPWQTTSDHPLNACANIRAGYHDVATLYGGSDDVPQPAEGEPWGPHPIRDATSRLITASPDLRDMVATLADALEAERAKVAAAYEAAAMDCARQADQVANAAITGLPEQARLRESMEAAFANAACRIRYLTPADAQAALDKMLAEARLEGWRAGREAAARSCVLSGQDLAEGGWGPEGRDMAVMLETRVIALPEPKEASHD